MNRLNRDMTGLRPGDVLTNLNCGGCRDKKILVLGRVDESLDFSVRASELNIARDPEGPWRWNMAEMVFKNADGEVYDHIGSDVEVLEGAGLRELNWYRKLPQPVDTRFHIDAKRVLGDLQEPAILAKWQALLRRSDNDQSMTVNMQLAIDLIFGDQAADMIDERRMRLLMSLVHNLAQQLGTNTLMRAKEATDGLMGRGRVGIKIMSLGPDGLGDMDDFFGDDVADLPEGLPPELRELIAALAGRRRGARPDGDRRPRGASSGNGHGPSQSPRRERADG